MEDTREHPINKMSCSENNIDPQIKGKESKQHKRRDYYHKMTVFRSTTPFCWGCTHRNSGAREHKLIKGMVLETHDHSHFVELQFLH